VTPLPHTHTAKNSNTHQHTQERSTGSLICIIAPNKRFLSPQLSFKPSFRPPFFGYCGLLSAELVSVAASFSSFFKKEVTFVSFCRVVTLRRSLWRTPPLFLLSSSYI
jgi:hypothetical protein